MTKLSLVALVAIALFAFGGSALLDELSGARAEVSTLFDRPGHSTDQSSAQISPAEFVGLQVGDTQEAVRSVVGKPERSHRVSIEQLVVDCWYYGIGGATGTYQLCFAGNRLSSKVGFARGADPR